MLELKPDRMNGQKIFRGVKTGSDGIRRQSREILFPPRGIDVKHGPVLPLEELVDGAMRQLITVSDKAGPEARAQAKLFEAKLRRAIAHWMRRAELNERERCRLALERHGLGTATHALLDGAK